MCGYVRGERAGRAGGGLLVVPFAFVSSAYVPVATLPGWLQAVAEHSPVTYMVDAVRALTLGPGAEAALGHAASFYVTRSLLWAVAFVAIFAPLTIARFRRG